MAKKKKGKPTTVVVDGKAIDFTKTNRELSKILGITPKEAQQLRQKHAYHMRYYAYRVEDMDLREKMKVICEKHGVCQRTVRKMRKIFAPDLVRKWNSKRHPKPPSSSPPYKKQESISLENFSTDEIASELSSRLIQLPDGGFSISSKLLFDSIKKISIGHNKDQES